jgi:ribosomal protein S18 acetylase RimI-like enzyme
MALSDSELAKFKTHAPVVSALETNDLREAARILRLAFGRFLGAADPETFWSDRDYVHGRHGVPHIASFAARIDGKPVGSAFATKWGSVGFFGPLSVHPDIQERGIGRALLDRAMAQFDTWESRHVGLFTFAQSAKHVALYQKYGFYPRFLTAIMSRPVAQERKPARWTRFSALRGAQQDDALRSCREAAETVYAGLDLTDEIRATQARDVGDTVLLEGPRGVAAFAVCHYGPKSEAGAGFCFIKFAAVREGAAAEKDYARLLDACETLGAMVGMTKVLAGVNLAREKAYRHLVARGYRTEIQGVAMHRDNNPGYCRPGAYVIDDWR